MSIFANHHDGPHGAARVSGRLCMCGKPEADPVHHRPQVSDEEHPYEEAPTEEEYYAAVTAARPADEHTQTAADIEVAARRTLAEFIARHANPFWRAWTDKARDHAINEWILLLTGNPLHDFMAAAEQRGRDETARKVRELAEQYDDGTVIGVTVANSIRRALADRDDESDR